MPSSSKETGWFERIQNLMYKGKEYLKSKFSWVGVYLGKFWDRFVKGSAATIRSRPSTFAEIINHGNNLGFLSAHLLKCAEAEILPCQLDKKDFIEKWQKDNEGKEFELSTLKKENIELYNNLYHENGVSKTEFELALVPTTSLREFVRKVGKDLAIVKERGHDLPKTIMPIPFRKHYLANIEKIKGVKIGRLDKVYINIDNYGEKASKGEHLLHFILDYCVAPALALVTGAAFAMAIGFSSMFVGIMAIAAFGAMAYIQWNTNADSFFKLSEYLLDFKWLFSKDYKWFSKKGINFKNSTWKELAATLWKGVKSLFVLGVGGAFIVKGVFAPFLATMQASFLAAIPGLPFLLAIASSIAPAIALIAGWRFFHGFGFTNTQIDNVDEKVLSKIPLAKDTDHDKIRKDLENSLEKNNEQAKKIIENEKTIKTLDSEKLGLNKTIEQKEGELLDTKLALSQEQGAHNEQRTCAQRLEGEKTELVREKAGLQQDKIELLREKNELQSEKTELISEQGQVIARLEISQKTLAQTKSDLETKNREVARLTNSLIDKTKKVAEQTTQIRVLNQEKANLYTQLQGVQTEFDTTKGLFEKTRQELEHKSVEIQEVKERIGSLEREKESVHEAIRIRDGMISELEQQVETVNSEKSDLVNKVNELENEPSEFEDLLLVEQREHRETKEKLEQAEQDLEEVQEQLAELRRQLLTLQAAAGPQWDTPRPPSPPSSGVDGGAPRIGRGRSASPNSDDDLGDVGRRLKFDDAVLPMPRLPSITRERLPSYSLASNGFGGVLTPRLVRPAAIDDIRDVARRLDFDGVPEVHLEEDDFEIPMLPPATDPFVPSFSGRISNQNVFGTPPPSDSDLDSDFDSDSDSDSDNENQHKDGTRQRKGSPEF